MNKYQFEKYDTNCYMDVPMVSSYLHVAKSTVYKWVGDNYIPHRKLGNRVLFIKEHIDQWILVGSEIVEELPSAPKYKSA